MGSARGFAIAAIVLIAVNVAFRAIASKCTGAACDAYIPVSALIPLLIFLAVAVAAGLATAGAGRPSPWFPLLLALAAVSVAGPIAALLIFRDSPDAFVATGTGLELVIAVIVLGYTFLGKQRQAQH